MQWIVQNSGDGEIISNAMISLKKRGSPDFSIQGMYNDGDGNGIDHGIFSLCDAVQI